MARRLDVIRPDIVHVHNAPALFAELARRYRGPARWILHMHNAMPIERLPPGTVLLVVSRYLKNWYAARLPGADIRIVTNGVDTDVFQPLTPAKIDGLHTRLKLPTDRKIVLYAGRISPEKGPLDLVHAFGELRKIRHDVLLVLVGEVRTGADRRGDYGRQLLAACEALGADCYHAGTVDPARMHEYYQTADLAVVPSEFEEPFGMVAIEAMAAGTPVLAARRGGWWSLSTRTRPGSSSPIPRILPNSRARSRNSSTSPNDSRRSRGARGTMLNGHIVGNMSRCSSNNITTGCSAQT